MTISCKGVPMRTLILILFFSLPLLAKLTPSAIECEHIKSDNTEWYKDESIVLQCIQEWRDIEAELYSIADHKLTYKRYKALIHYGFKSTKNKKHKNKLLKELKAAYTANKREFKEMEVWDKRLLSKYGENKLSENIKNKDGTYNCSEAQKKNVKRRLRFLAQDYYVASQQSSYNYHENAAEIFQKVKNQLKKMESKKCVGVKYQLNLRGHWSAKTLEDALFQMHYSAVRGRSGKIKGEMDSVDFLRKIKLKYETQLEQGEFSGRKRYALKIRIRKVSSFLKNYDAKHSVVDQLVSDASS